MGRLSRIVGLFLLLAFPALALGEEWNPAAYTVITQEELVKNPAAHMGKKYRVTDPFQFCGSDFCVQIQKTKINTREYFCVTLGALCLVRMYVKKDHPDAPLVSKLKKGDQVTVYGTFDHMGSNYRYMVVDRLTVEKGK
ncbi:MAG TPA: hypothetical protein VN450_05530 [Candidatus Methylomirabilis sp.]|nr:hypothetical protein [Candidatus Methylomirabilis sp.]